MKYIQISQSETLSDITEKVGVRNVDQILADNGLERLPKIGQQLYNQVKLIQQTTEKISAQRKLTLLNQFVDNLDIYEKAALSDDEEWKVISAKNTFPGYLYISDQLADSIPSSYFVLGNGESVPSSIYSQIDENWLNTQPLNADIFSYVSTIRNVGLVTNQSTVNQVSNPMSWFNLPTDKITLYSSITGQSMNIPVYPEEFNDSRIANYTQMPDLLYQYEPWQMYQSSGPRSNTFNFHLHRDMWTGDHTDGKANELIRFCQAQLYPNYNGASVITPTVSLYISGNTLISGIMTQVDVSWGGPIGTDDWYLEFTLTLSITEVAESPLNYTSVLNKSLIG